MAQAYENLDKPSDALKYYKIAIAKGFNEKENYVYCYTRAINLSDWVYDFKASISLCLEAIAILPENENFRKLLGEFSKKSGETEIYNFNPFRNI